MTRTQMQQAQLPKRSSRIGKTDRKTERQKERLFWGLFAMEEKLWTGVD